MTVDPKVAEAFLKDLLKMFDESPASLNDVQRRIAGKYRESFTTIGNLVKDAEQLQNQIKQASARVRSLDLQIADAQGKAQGFLELLVSLQFENEIPKSVPLAPPVESVVNSAVSPD